MPNFIYRWLSAWLNYLHTDRYTNVETFTESQFKKAAKRWAKPSGDGIRRLFLVDYTRAEFGNFLVYHPEDHSLRTPPASGESLAMILASSPWQLRLREGIASSSLDLRSDEDEPEHRIVLNPIAGDSLRVVGIAGMILDEDYFRTRLLPELIEKTYAGFFPGHSPADLLVEVRDGGGGLVLGDKADVPGALTVSATFPFVFTDWTLSVHLLASAPEKWARTNTTLNMLLSVLLAVVLMGGIVLSLRAANRAMRLSEMKSDFVSNVSHELRTPLASIRVFAEFLRTGRATEEERVRQYGEHIEGESRRLSRLIDNILDFAKIESGRKTYRFNDGDLDELIEECLAAFRLRAAAKEFRIEYEGPDQALPPMRFDADAVGQAIDNLLDNALKYSEERRSITVRLRRAGDGVLLEVEDKGIGVAREEQEHIFDRFHRVGRGPVHDVKGSGLGLAIVQHVALAHGGDVSVESEPGRGSTFTIRLPLDPSRASSGLS